MIGFVEDEEPDYEKLERAFEEISLKDGTKAYRTHIKWQWKSTLELNTLIVSAFKDGKWVYSAVNTSGDPKEAAWVAESMTFD